MILVIRKHITAEELRQMLEVYQTEGYIKLAVDLEQEIIAGGGVMHYECEEVLLEQEGSQQHAVWGAGWYFERQETTYDSFINIRPAQGNRDIEIQDEQLKMKIRHIVERLLSGVTP